MTLRTLDADGTCHFSQLKKLAKSGTQYLHACNAETEPTRDMLIGTVTHMLLLGPRPGAKPIVRYDGRRAGEKWETFQAEHSGAEIVNATEWAEGEQMAEAVRRSPVAMERLAGARLEVPLQWDEDGIPCSTSGVDMIPGLDLGDLKTTATTMPATFMRHSFQMLYPQQLAFYRRGAIANGLQVRKLFILGVERRAPFEVVELDLTDAMVEFADKSITKWLEKLRNYRLSIPEPQTVYDWPGYAQAPLEWDVPSWGESHEDEEEAA